jgi:hypothetical protein
METQMVVHIYVSLFQKRLMRLSLFVANIYRRQFTLRSNAAGIVTREAINKDLKKRQIGISVV